MSFENWVILIIVISFAGGLFAARIIGGCRKLGGDDRINKRIFKG